LEYNLFREIETYSFFIKVFHFSFDTATEAIEIAQLFFSQSGLRCDRAVFICYTYGVPFLYLVSAQRAGA
jgi:hypothetical protein